jgi:hypothetical protein
MPINAICVYCGSSDKVDGVYLQAAREMGQSIAGRGHTLVYGGGSTGLMGAVADSVLAAGGEVTGVITEQFNTPQLAHGRLTKMEVLPSMHERKARMAALADAFVVLPGGFGTMEEFFEALTWAQIGLHAKPVGLLNTDLPTPNMGACIHRLARRMNCSTCSTVTSPRTACRHG